MTSRAARNAARTQATGDRSAAIGGNDSGTVPGPLDASDPIEVFHAFANEVTLAPGDGQDLVIAGARTPDGGFAYIRMTEDAAREFVQGILWSIEQ